MALYIDEQREVEIELSKFDKKMFDLTEVWEQAEGWDKVVAQFEFIVAAFGKSKEAQAYLKDRLKGTSASTVDLMESGALFMELQSAYDEIMRNTENAIMQGKYQQMGELTENLAPVISAINAVENMSDAEKAIAAKQTKQGRQGFKRIK